MQVRGTFSASRAWRPTVGAGLTQTLGLMTTIIAVLALLISVGSLAFGIYQYRIVHRVRVREKAISILRFAHDLRRKSEDLKHLIGCTDDVDDCSEFLAKYSRLVEDGISQIAISKTISLEQLMLIEQSLLPLELEVDLLHKQVAEAGRFNEEIRAHRATQAKRNEA